MQKIELQNSLLAKGTIWLSSLLQKGLTRKLLLSLSNGFSTKYSQKNASPPHLRVYEFSTLILELVPHQPQMSILRPVAFLNETGRQAAKWMDVLTPQKYYSLAVKGGLVRPASPPSFYYISLGGKEGNAMR